MVGKILDYEAKDIRNAGRAELLISPVQKKLAKNKPVEVIAEELETEVGTIREIIKQMNGQSV